MGLTTIPTLGEEIPQVRLHPNAKLTPVARRLLVDRVEKFGWAVARAARAAGVSRQTAYKWLKRFREAGKSGLRDRSCRPRTIPIQTPRRLIRRMEQLRRRRQAGWEISQAIGIPVSTVSKHLKALGLGRIWRIEESLDPPKRYEHPVPGELRPRVTAGPKMQVPRRSGPVRSPTCDRSNRTGPRMRMRRREAPVLPSGGGVAANEWPKTTGTAGGRIHGHYVEDRCEKPGHPL